jgi:sodium transport system permease protein
LNAFGDTYDLATVEDVSKMLFTMLIPFLMLIFLYSGAMAVATESIAGEKERGTIATILITPIKRSHVALGKVLALSITALASAMVSFIAVIASIPKLMSGTSGVDVSVSLDLGIKEYLALFIVITLTVLLFTVILSIISTFAKSIKEASTYATPVMVLVTIVGVMGFVTEGAVSSALYLIPIYNSVAMISSIFAMAFNPLGLLLFTLADLIVIALGTVALAKMFSSERIMFNK